MSNLSGLLDRYKGLVIFDTETSGLDPNKSQIIELAALRVERTGAGALRIAGKMDTFVKLPDGELLPDGMTAEYAGEYECTAYDANCDICDTTNITATGTKPTPGITAAADWDVLPGPATAGVPFRGLHPQPGRQGRLPDLRAAAHRVGSRPQPVRKKGGLRRCSGTPAEETSGSQTTTWGQRTWLTATSPGATGR